ncbi:hypothetical protein V8P82_16500 [Acinetobacter baumannii]
MRLELSLNNSGNKKATLDERLFWESEKRQLKLPWWYIKINGLEFGATIEMCIKRQLKLPYFAKTTIKTSFFSSSKLFK